MFRSRIPPTLKCTSRSMQRYSKERTKNAVYFMAGRAYACQPHDCPSCDHCGGDGIYCSHNHGLAIFYYFPISSFYNHFDLFAS